MQPIVVSIVLVAFLAFVLRRPKNAADYSYTPNRGKVGENDVSFILRSLPPEYHVLNDVIIPDQGASPDKKYTTQIDHVVVSPYGIFVIETKNYSGWIFGNEDSKNWKQTFKTTEAHYLYNPIKQNWGHTYALAERLKLKIKFFKPIVVFSDDCELHVESTTPVVYMSQLRDHILSYKQEIIPLDDVEWIYNWLNKLNLFAEKLEEEHIQSIGERFVKKEIALEQGKCPRCGGDLIVRNGKYGAFYGCSNYPKCRFTHEL